MSTILVTGGTGTLGRPTVTRLRAAGHDVRVLSRRPGDGRVVGDLATGAGLAAALAGVDTVVHLATTASARDVPQARALLDASAAAGLPHLIYVSIVGIDDIPFAYYRAKLAIEALLHESGTPFTVLRATQFHEFVAGFARAQRRSPVWIALDAPLQPVAVDDVAARVAELAAAPPAGRVPDLAGPDVLSFRDAMRLWQAAHGIRRPIIVLPAVGGTLRAFRRGAAAPGAPAGGGPRGTVTFAQWLDAGNE